MYLKRSTLRLLANMTPLTPPPPPNFKAIVIDTTTINLLLFIPPPIFSHTIFTLPRVKDINARDCQNWCIGMEGEGYDGVDEANHDETQEVPYVLLEQQSLVTQK